MAEAEQPPAVVPDAVPLPWRGPLAVGCLALVAALGPSLWADPYTKGFAPYVVRVVLLATAVGAGIGGWRSALRWDRLLGAPAAIVGGGLAVLIVADCLRILGW
jgi:hypothetical protein